MQEIRFEIEDYDRYGEQNFKPITVDAVKLPYHVVLGVTRSDTEFVYHFRNSRNLPILKLLSTVSLDDHCTYSNYDEYDVQERKMVQAVVEEAIKFMTRGEENV